MTYKFIFYSAIYDRTIFILGCRVNLSKVKRKWFRRQLLIWGKQHRRKFPWRNTKDAYAILVAEFMLMSGYGI